MLSAASSRARRRTMADSRSVCRLLPDDGLGIVSGIIAAAIAVIGTLLGAAVGHRYQERTAALSAAHADRERSHRRLLDACADYIALAEDYRRAQYNRWTASARYPTPRQASRAGPSRTGSTSRSAVAPSGSVSSYR